MPSAQIEIGEQEDDQGRGDGRLDPGAPDPLRGVLEAEHFPPEAEVDADVGEHGPGQRGGGGEDDRAAHDEHDRQEKREQAGDADQDAFVEREAGGLVLEGVGLPQIELRQRRRAQFGDIGHGRSGIERQPEHVGVGVVLPLGRLALAGGDRGDARGAEIGPDHARADEAEMRRDDQAGQLLVGVVGQREHDPGRLGPRLERADLDAPDDAVCARRRRHLDAVAMRAVVLDGAGEVDRVGIGGHAHRLDRQRRPAGRKGRATGERPSATRRRRDAASVRAPGQSAGRGGRSVRRRAMRYQTNQAAVVRVRASLSSEREQNMVAPGAVDLQITARIALPLEAVALKERDRGRVVGNAGRLHPMETQLAEGEFDRRRDRAGHASLAGVSGAHPVAERPGLRDAAAHPSQRDAAEQLVGGLVENQEGVGLVAGDVLFLALQTAAERRLRQVVVGPGRLPWREEAAAGRPELRPGGEVRGRRRTQISPSPRSSGSGVTVRVRPKSAIKLPSAPR